VNTTHVSELLERAAASVTPAETDPARRLAGLGRRSVRRRRFWQAAGSVAAVIVAVVAVPMALTVTDRADPARPESTVTWGGLVVAVPQGWRTSTVSTFDSCTAEPETVYLAGKWEPGQPTPGQRADTPSRCTSDGQAWIAIVQKGVGLPVNPTVLMVKDKQLIGGDQPDQYSNPSVWTYTAFTGDLETGAIISGDNSREQLLERVTWPEGPTTPPSDRLVLPDRVHTATSEMGPPTNGMTATVHAETVNQIRAALAELNDPVPAGAECTLRRPGSIGIVLSGPDGIGVTVVLGDATCPQAISTGGGRVKVPAGLGADLLELVMAGDRADD
jgi:hypothetical protein